MKETYKVKTRCENCGKFQTVDIPKGHRFREQTYYLVPGIFYERIEIRTTPETNPECTNCGLRELRVGNF